MFAGEWLSQTAALSQAGKGCGCREVGTGWQVQWAALSILEGGCAGEARVLAGPNYQPEPDSVFTWWVASHRCAKHQLRGSRTACLGRRTDRSEGGSVGVDGPDPEHGAKCVPQAGHEM